MFNVDDGRDMPRDVINRDCLCQIIGRGELTLENYTGVKKVTDTEIEVLCKKYKIRITGANLIIKYYNDESMVIGGLVGEISFC